jgi:hypothetical protein
MRARTQAPVNSRRTAWAVRPLRCCTRVEIASVVGVRMDIAVDDLDGYL